MKTVCTILFISILFLNLSAQEEKSQVDVLGKNVVTVVEDSDSTEVIIGNKFIRVVDKYHNDTTIISIGNRKVEIVEHDGRTRVRVYKYSRRDDDEWWSKRKRRFNGHWAGFELGINGFYEEDYSMYDGQGYGDFMDLYQQKSFEVNLNFLEANIKLQKERNYIGLVTGMGLSFNSYKFDNHIQLVKEDGIIKPEALDVNDFKKSKLSASYLTVPLILEFQFPTEARNSRLFLAGGVIGGINIGAHTKVKYEGNKEKDRGNFNVNPFKYALTVRGGYGNFCVYANYNLSPLFKENKGPEMFPFSVGISLINF